MTIGYYTMRLVIKSSTKNHVCDAVSSCKGKDLKENAFDFR